MNGHTGFAGVACGYIDVAETNPVTTGLALSFVSIACRVSVIRCIGFFRISRITRAGKGEVFDKYLHGALSYFCVDCFTAG
jgi:hypothetical protein